ncbi:GAF domain-containing protein [Halotia branconii]|uniref:Circadian input-output histidine kinase CikA n=1 Tax=Halotia branconii CENA392 TaxID=1539056 RepID=A0AAJ6NRD4_9CYAN|nr:GAF domain-containing protein [Halotia branconii]WGV25318.1 GAF domain-containing protein [Halotia branconii CENA392]
MTDTSPKPIVTTAVLPANEVERLEALRRYNILDTPPEVAFDRITSLAARLFNMPIALVSLVDESRGWFKSSYGFDVSEVQRDETICSLALLSNEILIIPDTKQDSRLAYNPFVQNEPGLRFYAGAPLITQDNFNLGTLCLLDTQPRNALTDEQKAVLADLAAVVMDELEMRSAAHKIVQLEIAQKQQAEAAKQKEQELLRVLLDNVQAGIVACNAEGILTLFNRAAREFHGLPEQPLPPDEWAEFYDLYLSDGKTRMSKNEIPLFRALQGQTIKNVEMVIAPKHGKAKTLLASGQAIANSQGENQGAVVVMHDITERKQVEAERVQLVRQQVQEQNARLKAEADQRRWAFLAEVSTALASSLDYEYTLTSVANLIVPFFADWCAIDLLEDNQFIHRVAVAHRDPTKAELGWKLHRQYPRQIDELEGVPNVLRTGKTEMGSEIPDAALVMVAQDAEHLRMLRELGLKSAIVSPLIARGQILGAISFVTAESDRHYNEADVTLAEDITHRAAIAIDNTRLYREAQQSQQAAEQSAEHMTRLQSVTAAFSESLTPLQVADVIVDQGIAALSADFALVALVNETGTELEVVRAVGCEPEQIKAWQRFSINEPVPLAEAVRTGQPIWAEPSQTRAIRYPHLTKHYEQHQFDAWISVPLMVEGRAVGGMSFGFIEPQYLDGKQQVFILSLAQQCAQAIARTRLYEAEQTARSAAETANRVKDEFLAVLSHELRTPLNPILGWSRLLQSQNLDPIKTTEALKTIERNAKLQAQLIEDLLDVSRILQGKLNLNITPVNLASIISDAMETVRLAADAKSIQIQTILQPNIGQVAGDSSRLQQIVWNLLSNAIKFTPSGGQVEIRLERLDSVAKITVSDNGEGILPQFLPYVFDYFRQADSTTTRKFGGLGLGLAIVRQLVELHGGTIQAESLGKGLGATFEVKLPLLLIPEQTNQVRESVEQALGLNGMKILVVDDDADSREFFAFLLEQEGAEVVMADSATEALAALRQFQPDLLLSDIGMPQINGYILIQQIRNLPPDQGGNIPAIALTAYAGEMNEQQAIKAGFQRHISKPVEPVDLISVICGVMRRSI